MSVRGDVVLEARHLSREFRVRAGGGLFGQRRVSRAVEDVSVSLRAGEVLAVVGESGSGKSVLARMLARIVAPTSGELILGGEVVNLSARRGLDYVSQVQLVLQDPFASVNPVRLIRHALERPLAIHGTAKDDLDEQARAVLESVALSPAAEYLDRYPHELSGGMQQRVALVRALALGAPLMVMDEPFAALDEITRDEMRALLARLVEARSATVLFVTHSIAEAVALSDRVVVCSPRPASVVANIHIDLPRPRPADIDDMPRFIELCAQVRHALHHGATT